ncbi:TPA: restriction endonuclease subunit S [Enterococcus faecium]|nr:restriction endonuclease subunit S [Enterococcus faecium]
MIEFSTDNLPYEKVGKNEPVCIVDEIPFDIPDSWEWVRLIEVCEYIQRGKSPKYSTIKKYPVIAQKCNQWDGFSIEKAKFIEPDSLQSYGEERLLQDNDLMWNSTGLGTLGRIAIYKSALNPYELAVADSHVTVIRPFKAFILPEYLYYYFANPSVQNVIEDKADGTTKQKELATATIKAYLVPIPPLDEQKRILEKLEEVLPIVEKYKVVYDTAESLQGTFPDHLKKSILLQAVQGKLVPQDPADEPAEVLLERIREEKQRLIKEGKIKKDKHESIIFRRDNSHYEKLDGVERCIDDEIPFDLPESWTWVRLGYLVKVESGKSLTSKEMKPGKIPVYGGNGITGYHNKYLVDKETVVIGRVGYYCGSVYITEPKAWVTDNAFITTYPTGCIDRDYLVFTLRSMNLGQNNNATAQPVVSGKKIYPKLFPLPPLEEQKRIAIKLKEILPLCKIM